MNYDDLPAKARAQVDAQLGRRTKKRLDQGVSGGPCPYRCHRCGEESSTWPEAERHGRRTGHVRQDLILGA